MVGRTVGIFYLFLMTNQSLCSYLQSNVYTVISGASIVAKSDVNVYIVLARSCFYFNLLLFWQFPFNF